MKEQSPPEKVSPKKVPTPYLMKTTVNVNGSSQDGSQEAALITQESSILNQSQSQSQSQHTAEHTAEQIEVQLPNKQQRNLSRLKKK